jgi:CRP/FNR family transcriptional regulator, cyclic AMP receptor protein
MKMGRREQKKERWKDGKMMPLEEEVRLLSRMGILEPLSEEDLRGLLRRSLDTHLEAGETFFTPEDTTERLFILKKGRVRVFRAADGRELTLAEIDPGTIFGEMALTAQRLRGSYAQATEPSILISMSRPDLEHIIEENPQVGTRLVHLLSERLASYESRMEDLTLKEIPARLANLILFLCEGEGVMTRQDIKIPHHYTHERLGTMIGANREAVTRAFSKLQDEGAVELRRRLIHVSDIEALRRVAGHLSPQDINP